MAPLALLLGGCANEESYNIESELVVERVFTTSFEQNETRTYIEEGNLLRWNAGDQVSLFNGNTLNRQYKFDGETGDNAGTFSIVSNHFGTGNELNCHYAVYPYSSDVKITENGVITATLPANQNYKENSFGLGANTMVAVTKDRDDTFLKFRNTGGYLKLQLYGNDIRVKSITLTGNNNEKLAGKVNITPIYGQEPTTTMIDGATSSITLNCGEGVQIGSTIESATDFWMAVPTTKFANGLSITIEDTDGGTFVKSTSCVVDIERNVIKPMKAFEVVKEETIPNNQIWYTTNDEKVLYYLSMTSDLTSHTYDNGKGIITYNNDITDISESAFFGCSSLTSIALPNSVSVIGDSAFNGCFSLKNISLPNSLSVIGNNAFGGCSCLTNISLPNSVSSIGTNAFMFCTSLTSVTIPDNVTYIGWAAFAGCTELKEFKGKYAADGGRCLIQDNAIISYANASGVEYTIPDNVTTIRTASIVFTSLTSLTIPDSVIKIEINSILRCVNLKKVKLLSATPPTISGKTFVDCNNDNLEFHIPAGSLQSYQSADYWRDFNNYIEY